VVFDISGCTIAAVRRVVVVRVEVAAVEDCDICVATTGLMPPHFVSCNKLSESRTEKTSSLEPSDMTTPESDEGAIYA
jgi:hypothetical protein